MVRLPAIAALFAVLTLASCGDGKVEADGSVGTTAGASPAAGGAVAEVSGAGAAAGPGAKTIGTPVATSPGRRRTMPRELAGRTFVAAEVDGPLLTYGTVLRIEFGERVAVAFAGFEHDRVCSYVGIFDVSIQGRRLRLARPPSGGSSAAPGIACSADIDDQKRWFANWLPSRPQFELNGRRLLLRDADVRIAFTEK